MQLARWILPGNGCRGFFKQRGVSGSRLACIAAICLHAFACSTFAGDFDGSKQLSGTTGKIIEVNRYKIVDNVDPDRIGLPKKFIIDFKARMLRPSKESVVRKTISFKRIDHLENSLILQGIDDGVEGISDGLAWSLTISKKDGASVLAASGDGVAYVVFGTVAPLNTYP